MNVYVIDVGAKYWVAAESMGAAVAEWWSQMLASEIENEVEGHGLKCDVLAEDAARETKFADDDGEEISGSMWDAAQAVKSAEVLACSEWG